MYQPDFDEFLEKTKQGTVIPVCREILADMDTPVTAYYKIREHSEYSFLLETVEEGDVWSRYSFLGNNPRMVILSKDGRTELIDDNRVRVIEGDPLNVVEDVMSQFKMVDNSSLPRFTGGAVGYLSYDMIRFFEKLDFKEKKSLNLPDVLLMINDTLLIFDNITRKIKIVSNVFVDDSFDAKTAYQKAIKKIEVLIERLRSPVNPSYFKESTKNENYNNPKSVNSNVTQQEFENAVVKSKEYIADGDAFQIVISQRFEQRITTDPFNIYRALRIVNPSPYMYFFHLKDMDMFGSSPEILVRAEDKKITVKPIAGTRKRGKDNKEDERLARDLVTDTKEVAEHIMLVDLGRNDLGRVAKVGTIQVEDIMALEKYSHVMHMTTQVTGELAEGKSCYDVIRATFPAGTVSGAPKIRAMEIIEELENTRRGPYAGAVGYISFSGNIDTCINIRSIIVKDSVAYIQAGAGIVADSVPENEFVETQSKSNAMLAAIKMAEEGL